MSDLIKKIKIKKQDGTYTDYIPIGAEAKNVDCSDGESVEYKLSNVERSNSKKPYYYNTVADMKADEKLKDGDFVITLGYYTINDGGGAEYKIINNTSNYAETLINNLKAELIIKDKLNVKQIGAYGDNSHDDSAIIQTAFDNYSNIYIPNGDYKILNTIIIPDNSKLKMENNVVIHLTTNIDVFQIGNFIEIEGGQIRQDYRNLTGYVITHKNVSYGCYIHNIMLYGNPTSNSVKTGGFLKYSYTTSNQYTQFNNYDDINVNWVDNAIYAESDGTNNWITACHYSNWRIWHCTRIFKGRVDGCNFDGLTIQTNPTDTLLFEVSGKWNNFRNLIYFDLPNNCNIVEFKADSGFNTFELWYTGENYPSIYENRYINNGNRNAIKLFKDLTQPAQNITLNSTYWEGNLSLTKNSQFGGALIGTITCLNLNSLQQAPLGNLPVYVGNINLIGVARDTGEVMRIEVLENKSMVCYNAIINKQYDIYQYIITLQAYN